MSQYDTGGGRAETEQQLAKGAEVFLSGDERAQVRRLLGFPEEFPPEFKEWLVDYIAVNIPQIPISQLVGFNQTQFYIGTHEDGLASTTSTNYIQIGEGPYIAGMGPGDYLFFHGCALKASAGGIEARQTLSFPNETPVTDNALFTGSTEYTSSSRMVAHTLTESSNLVKCMYKVEGVGTGFFQLRWLFALRYA